MIKIAKRKGPKVLRKLWSFWTSTATAVVAVAIGGSLASKALSLPTWLNWIPAPVGVAVGWFIVGIAVADFVTSMIDTFMR